MRCPPRALLAVTAVLAAGSCSTPAARSSRPAGAPTGPPTTPLPATSPPPAPPSTALPRDGNPHFAVGTIVRDFVDTTRHRTLRTIVHYPAGGPPGGPGTTPAPGSFPLVLMAHGFRLPASGYERILDRVTSAGYIVAAPAFPHTSAETGDGQRGDIVNQPGDLSFVTDAVIQLARAEPGVLPAVDDPDRVAALGHSDGGLTVSAWAYDSRFRDRRVAAVVEMSGGTGMFPGTYFTADSPPLLAIHATADETNPYAASVALVNAVPAGIPRFLVTIEGGSHLGPYMGDTALPQVGQVIVDFLDGYFAGSAGARARLLVDGDVPGVMSIR